MLQQRAYDDGTFAEWDTSSTPSLIDLMGDSACLVFMIAFATEGIDREGAGDDYSDDLVDEVAKTCSKQCHYPQCWYTSRGKFRRKPK